MRRQSAAFVSVSRAGNRPAPPPRRAGQSLRLTVNRAHNNVNKQQSIIQFGQFSEREKDYSIKDSKHVES